MASDIAAAPKPEPPPAPERRVMRLRAGGNSVALITLAVLAVFYTLYFASAFVLPLLFAVVLTLLLAPAKRVLTDRLGLPGIAAALLLIIGLFIAVFGVGMALAVPASNWLGRVPDTLDELQQRLGFLQPAIAFAEHGMEKLEHLMQPSDQVAMAVQPQSNLGGMGLSILQGTGAAIGELFMLAVMLLFLLSVGDSLLRRLVEVLPTFGEKRRIVEIATEIENNISGWLLTITAMNLLVGIVNGLSMWVLGMPDPLLWGTVAFLLNYIPILGPFTGIVIFFFVGLFSTPTFWQALLPPAVYLAVHTLEGQTVTPILLARRFTLNPVLVILSLFFWNWLWGVPGAFLSVPLLAIAKTVADRVPALMPLGHMIGGPPRGARGAVEAA